MEINISEDTLVVWQSLLDLLASKFIIPAALIMKVEMPHIKVFLSSNSEGNPYEAGDKECLIDSGLYCERVINTKSKLVIPNALTDPEWNTNPDIKLGMISYLGFPLILPNGEVFGTICILDSKENSFEGDHSDVVQIFRQYVESYLDLKYSKQMGFGSQEIRDKEAHADEMLTRIEKLLGIGQNRYEI
ncbi:MAG: GAF domain-containing protein [Puniceicoccaceae bacterium]